MSKLEDKSKHMQTSIHYCKSW